MMLVKVPVLSWTEALERASRDATNPGGSARAQRAQAAQEELLRQNAELRAELESAKKAASLHVRRDATVTDAPVQTLLQKLEQLEPLLVQSSMLLMSLKAICCCSQVRRLTLRRLPCRLVLVSSCRKRLVRHMGAYEELCWRPQPFQRCLLGQETQAGLQAPGLAVQKCRMQQHHALIAGLERSWSPSHGQILQGRAAAVQRPKKPKPKTEQVFAVGILQCGKTRNWPKAVALLAESLQCRVQADVAMECTLIALARGDQWQRSLQLLVQLERAAARGSPKPRPGIYTAAMGALRRKGLWEQASALLSMAEDGGMVLDLPIINTAIGVCGYGLQWERALELLDQLPLRQRLQPSIYSYNAAAAALGSARQWEHVLALAETMHRRAVALDDAMRDCVEKSEDVGRRQMRIDAMDVLSASDWREALASLRSLGEQAVRADARMHNAVLDACSRSSHWAEALAHFDRMKAHVRPTAASLTSVIAAMGAARRWCEALHMFWQTSQSGEDGLSVEVDTVLCITVLHALRSAGRWPHVLHLLTEMSAKHRRSGLDLPKSFLPVPDSRCFNVAISACADAALWQSSLALFRYMKWKRRKNSVPTAATFNAAIQACGQSNHWQHALGLFEELPRHTLRANEVTYLSLMQALNKAEADQLPRIPRLLKEMRSHSMQPGVTIFSAVIAACGGQGQFDIISKLLEDMVSISTAPNTVVLNIAMSAYIDCGQLKQAYDLFGGMPDYSVQPDLDSYNTILKGASKEGFWEYALEMLETIRAANFAPDVVSYTTAIHACRRGSLWREAVHLCWEMRSQRVRPDTMALGATINVCADSVKVDEGSPAPGSWAFALGLFGEAKLRSLPLSAQFLNMALQACTMASEWAASIGLVEDFGGKFYNLKPDLVTSNLHLTALCIGHQWRVAIDVLENEWPARGHLPDASTYNTCNAAVSSESSKKLQKVNQYLLRCLMVDQAGLPYKPDSHVLDLHDMSLPSAKAAVRVALDEKCGSDVEGKALLILTGKGKHSADGALLQSEVAELLQDELHVQIRPTTDGGGIYVPKKEVLRLRRQHAHTPTDVLTNSGLDHTCHHCQGLDPSALIASISNGIVGKQQWGNGPKWAVTSTINFNAFDFLKACAGAA
eukprot:s2427_g4.t1